MRKIYCDGCGNQMDHLKPVTILLGPTREKKVTIPLRYAEDNSGFSVDLCYKCIARGIELSALCDPKKGAEIYG